jgi:hypothetical protein
MEAFGNYPPLQLVAYYRKYDDVNNILSTPSDHPFFTSLMPEIFENDFPVKEIKQPEVFHTFLNERDHKDISSMQILEYQENFPFYNDANILSDLNDFCKSYSGYQLGQYFEENKELSSSFNIRQDTFMGNQENLFE